MKKIKVIGKTLLIVALVASSAQMSASTKRTWRHPFGEGKVVQPLPVDEAAVKRKMMTIRQWMKENPKKTGGAIALAVLGGILAYFWWRKENPGDAEDLESSTSDEPESPKGKIQAWDVTRTHKRVDFPK